MLANLLLNNIRVGSIDIDRTEGAWSFGRFRPVPAFDQFAPIFAQWSRTLNAAEDRPQAPAPGDELRRSESDIDRLHAEIQYDGSPPLRVDHLGIDGDEIEWSAI